MDKLIKNVLAEYGFTSDTVSWKPFGSGHVNSTWLVSVSGAGRQFILQSINQNVFHNPEIIAENTDKVARYLAEHFPGYLFVNAIPTTEGQKMAYVGNIYWRLTDFVNNSVSFDTLSDPGQAYEAAMQFGRLSRLLEGFDISLLKPSIPGFHDLGLRYVQFKDALENAPQKLRQAANEEVQKAIRFTFILDYFNSYKNSKKFPDRVMHHDTKISNMLFDKDSMKGLCVIDLDTLMAGKFISDLGDMMRTYLCPFSENEPDPEKIFIRTDYFEAIIMGYLSEMNPVLTSTEKSLILFSGKYIIYMQALRFLTDYLKGSIYYPITYPEQNLHRTRNQFKLLAELSQNDRLLQDIVDKCLKTNNTIT